MTEGSLDTLIHDLANRGIRLWVEADVLKFSAPAGAMDAPLKARLRTRRDELVIRLDKASSSFSPPSTPDRIDRSGPVPASSEQSRLWHMERLEPNGAYSVPLGVHIRGNLDRPRLLAALHTLATRHDAFRTRFDLDGNGVLVQHIGSKPHFPILDHADVTEPVDAILKRLVAEPLNSGTGPIGRAHLLRVADDEHILLVLLHHMVTDGWSSGILIRDLLQIYVDGADALPPPELDFADFIAHRRSAATDPAARAYWTRQLAEAPSLSSFPGDRPRARPRAAQPGSVSTTLSADLSVKLNTFLQQGGISAFAVFSAIQALAVAILAGQRDVIIGSPAANRAGIGDIENCVGFFANLIATRHLVDLSMPFGDFVRQSNQHMRNALSHQSFPFDEAVEVSGVERDLAWTPLVQTVLAVQNLPVAHSNLPGLTLASIALDPPAARFDWATQAYDSEGGWHLRCEYDAGLYSATLAHSILHAMVRSLERGLADPLTTLTDAAAPLLVLHAANRPTQMAEAVLDRYHPQRRCRALVRGNRERQPVLGVFLEGPAPTWRSRQEICIALRSLTGMEAEIIPVGNWPLTGNGDTDLGRLYPLPMMPEPHISVLEGTTPGLRLASTPAAGSGVGEIDLTTLPPEILGQRTPRARGEQPVSLAPSGTAFVSGAPLDLPDDWPASLPEALSMTARRHPERGMTVIDGTAPPVRLSYAELFAEGMRVAAGLTARGVQPGAHIILLIPNLPAYFPALWGCLLAGAVPVTVAQPRRATADDAVFMKMVNAWSLLHHPLILCQESNRPLIEQGRPVFPGGSPQTATVEDMRGYAPLAEPARPEPDAIALLQLTSGSTGVAKGVQIRQRGVAAHIASTRQFNGYTAQWNSLNWLPHDHVGALLTYHLTDAWIGCEQVVVTPETILKEPGIWLDLLERHRITRSWSPNFGFKLLLSQAARSPERRWDLSSLKYLMNGGEQVTPPVLRAFEQFLLRNGARPDVMQPAFGMAEACSTVSYENGFSAATGICAYDKGILETGEPSGEVIELVSLGTAVPGCQLMIADADGKALPERRIGRFLIRGEVVTPGYFENPEASAACLIGDGWLDSGDLAFIDRERLFMTGRSKETIILNGANYYCHELEDIVSDIPGVLPTCVAAVGIREPDAASESLAMFFASDLHEDAALAVAIAMVRSRIIERFSVAPAYCLPLPPEVFPKGTSGKIQRIRLKDNLENGAYGDLVARFGQTPGAKKEPAWLAAPVWRRDNGQAWRCSPDPRITRLDPATPDEAIAEAASILFNDTEHARKGTIFGIAAGTAGASALAGAVAALAESAMLREPLLDARCVLAEGDINQAMAREACLKAPASSALIHVDAGGGRWTRGLIPAVPGTATLPFVPTAPALVMGGLGAIGSEIAADILQRGSGPVFIAGRSRAGKGAAVWERLTAIGGERVSFLEVDDHGQIPEPAPEIWCAGGLVVNAAGGGGDQHALTPETLTAALTAKRLPAEAVESAFAPYARVTIVHIGSVTGLFGGLGVEAYAAAHGWLDGLATGPARRVMAFSQWHGMGVSRGHAMLDPHGEHGLRPLSAEQAVRCFWMALSSGHPLVEIGVDLDARRMRPRSYAAPHRGEDWLLFGEASATTMMDAAGQPLPVTGTFELPAEPLPRDQLALALDSPRVASTQHAPPRGEAERRLFGIWGEILETSAFGTHDNFFAIGGSSLRLVRMHKAVEEAFERSIPLVVLYQHPTIASLAGHLSAAERCAGPSSPAVHGAQRAALRRSARRRDA